MLQGREKIDDRNVNECFLHKQNFLTSTLSQKPRHHSLSPHLKNHQVNPPFKDKFNLSTSLHLSYNYPSPIHYHFLLGLPLKFFPQIQHISTEQPY